MKNPHIIVGQGRRCICGVYPGRDIRCADVLLALDHAKSALSGGELPELQSDFAILAAVIQSLVVDCADEYEVVINGTPAKLPAQISYEKLLVQLGHDPERILSVTYYVRGGQSGCLSPGRSVNVEAGMIFNAMDTSNA